MALVGTYIAQFGNSMILSSFGLHFLIVSIAFIYVEQVFFS